MYKQS